MIRTPNPTDSYREISALLLLVVAALVITGLLSANTHVAAGPLNQQSPLSPLQQPTPTATAAVTPAVAPAAATAVAQEPPVPVALLAGIMLAIGVIALIVGLRRR